MAWNARCTRVRLVSSAPAIGDLLAARYRVEHVLGSGGTGVVVGARDEINGRAVAMKLLHEGASTPRLERFIREARTAARITSTHVVQVYELGATSGARPYMVMERLIGRDLGQRLNDEGPLPLRAVADCVVQACEALAHAHAAGIVHRDVKPSNLFEHDLGTGVAMLKVRDFGVSKSLGQPEKATPAPSQEGALVRTPLYLSPEHVRDARDVDPRSDLWSLGAVVYHLLGGQPPFEGESVEAICAAILDRPLVPLAARGLAIPAEIDAILTRCLSRDRASRFSHAGDLAAAFAPYASERVRPLADLAQEITGAMRTPHPDTSTRVPAATPSLVPVVRTTAPRDPSRRRARLAASIALGVLAMASAAALVSTTTPRTTPASAATPSPSPSPSPNPNPSPAAIPIPIPIPIPDQSSTPTPISTPQANPEAGAVR